MKLLVVEDDDRVMAALRAVLAQHGFDVACARTGEQALELTADRPDAVLLDLGLPDRDGFNVCAQIRRISDVPIIMVTARADPRSRVHGLNLGADDYLVKPYNVAELVARIHAVTRRAQPAPVSPLPPGLGPLGLDLESRTVTVAGRPVPLTVKEFDVLALLARRPGVVFRREQIMSEVWNTAWEGAGRTLEVHVGSLRQKLGVPGVIETVRGVGYRLVAATSATAPAAEG
jgi:DNA-binding response OmpR family regulator